MDINEALFTVVRAAGLQMDKSMGYCRLPPKLTTTRYWSPETTTDEDGKVINTVPVFRSIEIRIRLS
jgi:hypothetical protein